MSFSSETKAELCRDKLQKKCCAVAEACGVLLYCGSVTPEQIRIVTESAEFAQRLPRLFFRAFRVDFDETQIGSKFTFLLHDREKIAAIFSAIGYSPESSITLHVNYALLENDCCRRSFLRGVFLSGGVLTSNLLLS